MTELWDFLRGSLMTKALAAVVDAGVPEALADGPRPVSELQGDPDTLHRLLRALASDGVFRETKPGVFEHTEQSRLLLGARLERVRASLRRRLLRGDDRSRRVDVEARRSRAGSGPASGNGSRIIPSSARRSTPPWRGSVFVLRSGSLTSSGARATWSWTSAAATALCSPL